MVDATAAMLLDLRAQDARLNAVAWRLLTANTPLCRDLSAQPGLLFYDPSLYAAGVRAAAGRVFGLGDAATVAAVAPGSAAARAGVRVGDGLAAIDGTPLSPAPAAKAGSTAGVDRVHAAIQAGAGPVTLTIHRAGETRTLRFTPDRGCASFVQLVPERRRNAGADGRTISVTTALFAAAESDDEIAIIVGHELAHNILRHRVRQDEAKLSRGLLAGYGRNGARLRADEAEADRVGLYLAARAGYDPAAAPRFWTRYGRAHDPIVSAGTHPGWRSRVAALAAVARKIAAKRAAGEPILPGAPAAELSPPPPR